MRVVVELWAFQNGIDRVVEIPDDECVEGISDGALLNLVYHYGQNEIQPVADRCSVSMGDVIVLPYRSRYNVCMVGFEAVAYFSDDGAKIVRARRIE